MPLIRILDLPTELLAEITSLVEPEIWDLRQLRCVNKIFHSLATPWAFKNLTVYTTNTSAKGFVNLLDSPNVADHIQGITLVEHLVALGSAADVIDENLRYKKVRISLRVAFATLHRLPALGSLTLSFNPITWQVDSSRHFLLQWDVLGALGQNPNPLPSLRSLTIDKWMALPHTLYTKVPLARITASLRHLRIMVCADEDEDEDAEYEALSFFWHQVVENVLSPAVNLESLTIESLMIDVDLTRRISSFLNFNLLAYPRLTALSLGNIVWEDGSAIHGIILPGVEIFVVRHGKTLKKLELRSCAIDVPGGKDVPYRFWAAVWKRLANELTELVDLKVEFEVTPLGDQEMQYAYSDGEFHYIYFEEQVGTDEDAPALEAFRAIVEARKSNWEENGTNDAG